MIPRHNRHPKRDFIGFIAALVCVFFAAGAIGIGLALIQRAIDG
jgi:hypothetical protein